MELVLLDLTCVNADLRAGLLELSDLNVELVDCLVQPVNFRLQVIDSFGVF